jgi:hypothetical protein
LCTETISNNFCGYCNEKIIQFLLLVFLKGNQAIVQFLMNPSRNIL